MWVLTEKGRERLETYERYIMDCMLDSELMGPPDNFARRVVRVLTYVDQTGESPKNELGEWALIGKGWIEKV